MNRKLISKAISDIDDSFIAESMSPPVVKTDHAPERTSNMGKYENKRNGVNSRRLISLILAAIVAFIAFLFTLKLKSRDEQIATMKSNF